MESSSTSSQEDARWSSADAYIVDGVVAVLERARRWRRDGGSLRQLNKHWCQEMSRHVVSIDSSKCGFADLDNSQVLLKFPNLTSLNIIPFCWSLQHEVSPEKCSSVVGILHQLPRLTALKLDTESLAVMDKDEIDGLMCKTIDLVVDEEHSNHLFKLSDLPLEKMIFDYPIDDECLHRFLETVPTLKRMARFILFSIHNGEVDVLNSVEELEIDYLGDEPKDLSGLKSIVSLKLSDPIDSLDLFKHLERLKQLDLRIRSREIFDNAFWSVMQRLKHLRLRSYEQSINPPERFWKLASGLEELEINSFLVDLLVFMHHDFNNLRKLTLGACKLICDGVSGNGMISLTAQRETSDEGRDGGIVPDCFDRSPMRALQELSIFFGYQSSNLREGLLHFISQIKNLEFLELREVQGDDHSDDLPLDGFNSLRTLPRLSCVVIQGITSEAAICRLGSAEFLSGIEGVDLRLLDTKYCSGMY